MAIHWQKPHEVNMANTVISQATWYQNADKSAVTSKEDSPAAAFLLVRAGMPVEVDQLKKYGLPLDGSIPEIERETGLPVPQKSTDEIARLEAQLAELKAKQSGESAGSDGKPESGSVIVKDDGAKTDGVNVVNTDANATKPTARTTAKAADNKTADATKPADTNKP
jgi:hypothetical protein